MTNQEEFAFHPKYVAPFYGGLMNFNILNKEVVANPYKFLEEVRELGHELSDDLVLTLLNNSWRPSKVGAWVIGLCKKYHLEDDLISYLMTNPIYCEHAIIGLTILNSEKSAVAIKDFTKSQLNLILSLLKNSSDYQALENLGRHRIETAFSALQYLDKINKTEFFLEVGIQSSEWGQIKEEVKKLAIEKPRIEKLFRTYRNRFEATTSSIFDRGMKIINAENKDKRATNASA